MRDSTASKATVTKMESLGFNVFIDDFGTGYSSLSYLKSFPISALKIDRSFVIDLCKNPQDRAICGAIIAMAKGLGLTAIAEGVETEEQVKLLNELGCDQAQGFFFYEAVTKAQFAELLIAQAAAPPMNAKLELSNAGNLP